MDPLSITASSIAVLSAVTASGRGFSKLISLRKAPAEVLALSNEVQALRSLLVIVENSLLQIHDTKTYQTNKTELTALLQTVKDTVLDFEQTIEYRLKRAEGSSQDGMPKILHSQWLKAAPEIERLKQRIQDARSNLNVGLTAINIEIGEAVRRVATEIQSITLTPSNTNFPSEMMPFEPFDRAMAGSSNTTPSSAKERLHSLRLATGKRSMLENSLTVPDALPSDVSQASTDIVQTLGRLDNECASNGIIRVNITISMQKCERFCKCRCHVPSYVRTPQWLRRTLGELMFSYTNLIRPKPCNYPPCYRSPTKAHFTYLFPWWLASRALVASCIVDNLTGPAAAWTIRMPVVLPNGHRVWAAVVDNNMNDLKRMFTSNEATPFAVDAQGWNLLHRTKALDSRALLTIMTEEQYAVSSGLQEMHHFLLQQGVAADQENERRETPGDIAFRRGATDLFQYDLEDVAEGLRFTLLHVSLAVPSLQIAFTHDLLKQQCALINETDKFGMTPLHWASRLGNAYAVRLLLEWKADHGLVTKTGGTAVHEACWGNDKECVRLLLDAGCDVNFPDQNGETPLFSVRSKGDGEIILDMLIQRGAKIQHTNLRGETALHNAAQLNQAALIYGFIRQGAPLNARDKSGQSAIHLSILWDRLRNLEALSHASELNKAPLEWISDYDHRNALHFAALWGSISIIKSLAAIDLVGLEPLAQDRNGDTPNACFYEHRDYYCTKVREPFDAEETAWITLMKSVCEQNAIDPAALDWYDSVCFEMDDASVAESEVSNEENFSDALESLVDWTGFTT